MSTYHHRKWTHRYAWGNNPVRASIKGERCRILARGSLGTVLIETENGDLLTTSVRALRRILRPTRRRRCAPSNSTAATAR